jgi:truncated hemoglobin YjbI
VADEARAHPRHRDELEGLLGQPLRRAGVVDRRRLRIQALRYDRTQADDTKVLRCLRLALRAFSWEDAPNPAIHPRGVPCVV